MANKSRVDIGRGPTDLIRVALKLVDKHKEEGEKSPLHAILDIDWVLISTSTPLAQKKHEEAEELMRKAEAAYRERDNLLKPIDEAVRRSRNLLKTIHENNPKLLAEWGYDVSYSAPAKAKAEKASKTTKE